MIIQEYIEISALHDNQYPKKPNGSDTELLSYHRKISTAIDELTVPDPVTAEHIIGEVWNEIESDIFSKFLLKTFGKVLGYDV